MNQEKTILCAALGLSAFIMVGSIGVSNGPDRPDRPRPTQSPTPMFSCYYEQAPKNGEPYTGAYKPCEVARSVEDEERERIFIQQQEQLRLRQLREEQERKEFWEDVRRERLERERSGQTPGGPVTVPPPVPLPS